MTKIMAKTSSKSYLNHFKGEDWSIVEEMLDRRPSGFRKCYKFPDGFIVKIDDCKAKTVII